MSSIIHAHSEKQKKKHSNNIRGEKLTRKRVGSQQTKNNLINSRSSSSSPTPTSFNDDFIKKRNTIAVASDMKKNTKVERHHRKWSPITLKVFLILYLTSHAGYKLVNSSIITPSESNLRRILSNQKLPKIDEIVNISKIDEIISNYKTRNDINEDEKIYGVLAVDALSLTPVLKIKEDGSIEGLVNSSNLNKTECDKIKGVIQYQEKLIKTLKKNVTTDAFVFQFQPLSPLYKTVVLHIMGANNGKANNLHVKTLKKISKILQQNNLTVCAFSSDGDSGYRELVSEMLEKWNKSIDLNADFTSPLYTNDPLHILKRARYRSLSHLLYQINKSSSYINVSNLEGFLNLPSVIFSNSKITKMQDNYPIKLFDLSTFLKLHELDRLVECSFFLPFTLLQVALTENKLTIDDRVDLLEINVHYLRLYQDMLAKTSSDYSIPNNKTHGPLFDNALVNDTLVTCLSILSIIKHSDGIIRLNRIGTNPLEHHFGLLRIKSKYNDDFNTLLQSEIKVQIAADIEHEIIGKTIRNKRTSYGVDIFLDRIIYGNNIGYNHKIAYSICKEFGFPVNLLSEKISKTECEYFHYNFWNILNKALTNREIKKPKYIMNSKELTKHPSSGRNIRERQKNKKI